MGVVVVAACGVFLSGCDPPQVARCCSAEFALEVVNATSERIRLQVAMISGYFQGYPSVPGDDYKRTDIFELSGGSRTRFAMQSVMGIVDSLEDGFYVRGFGAVFFYAKQAQVPYRGYVYLGFGCGVEVTACGTPDDGALIHHRALDGTNNNLFLEAADRPFYLEVDNDNPDLGRLVITAVPSGSPDGPIVQARNRAELTTTSVP